MSSIIMFYINKFLRKQEYMEFNPDKFKEPPVIVGLVSGLITLIILLLTKQTAWVVVFFTFIVGFFFYLILNDMAQKKELEELQLKKDDNVKSSILQQREKDLQKEVCVSCNTPITDYDKPCPNCGFQLPKIEE